VRTNMPGKKKSITAGEMIAKLEDDLGYQTRVAERDRRISERVAKEREEQKSLLADLAAIGIDVETVWDLVNSSEPYPLAVPVLIAHLERGYSSRIMEGIVRALTVEPARGKAGPVLVRAFQTVHDEQLRWVIGNALSIVASSDEYNVVRELLRDTRYGSSRSMLAHAVARLGKEECSSELIALLGDGDVAAQVLIALGDIQAVDARGHVEEFTKHPNPWVRKQAKKALKKINARIKREGPWGGS